MSKKNEEVNVTVIDDNEEPVSEETQEPVSEDEVPEKKEKESKKEPKDSTAPKIKKVKIKLPLTKENKSPLFISVNNRNFMIKRGTEVEVPDFVAEQVRHNERMMEEQIAFVSDLEEEFEEKSKQL